MIQGVGCSPARKPKPMPLSYRAGTAATHERIGPANKSPGRVAELGVPMRLAPRRRGPVIDARFQRNPGPCFAFL
jgi:hypothetical protein